METGEDVSGTYEYEAEYYEQDWYKNVENRKCININVIVRIGVLSYNAKYITINSFKVNRTVITYPVNNVPSINYLHTSFATKDDIECKVSKNQIVNSGEESALYEYFVDNEPERIFTCGATHTYLDRCINRKIIDTNFVGWNNMEVSMNRDEYVPSLALMMEEHEKFILKTEPNTTITHYCPIEQDLNNIDDFVVGAPVYLTGKVYKYVENKFVPSTESDTTDCICSVKTNGKWNEFVGICTSKDDKCITFATHGDYLVRVTDTSCYGIGDEVFVDDGAAGSDGVCAGELKTLTGQTAITSKIRRTTVGIITAKISDTMLSVFKSYTTNLRLIPYLMNCE